MSRITFSITVDTWKDQKKKNYLFMFNEFEKMKLAYEQWTKTCQIWCYSDSIDSYHIHVEVFGDVEKDLVNYVASLDKSYQR